MSMLRTLCAEGHRGPVTFLHYAPDPERAIYRDELERIAAAPSQRSPGPLLHARARGRGGDGHFSLAQLVAVRARLRASRNVRLRPAGAAGRSPRAHGRAAAWSRDCTSRASFPRRWRRPAASPRARSTSPAPTCGSTTSGASLLEQAEGAGLSPIPAAAWASATPARCRKTAGTVKNLSTGEVSSDEDEEIQICVSAPIGDVVVEL